MTGIERFTSFMLLLTLMLAVYPMEQPGMLFPWLGVSPSSLFQVKLFKFSVVELLLGLALMSATIYRLSKSASIGYKNNFGGIFWMILLCIIWGYMGTIFEGGRFSSDNMGIVNWRRLVYGMVLFAAVTLFVDNRRKLRIALMAIVVAVLLLDVYGLFRYLFLGGISVHHYIGKVVFWETVKLALNVFVVVVALGALVLEGGRLSKTEKRVYTVAVFLAYAVIFLSARRTSMVMTMIASSVYVMILARRGRVALAMAIVGVGSLVVITVALLNYDALETKLLSRFESIAGVFDSSVEVDKGSTQGHIQDLKDGWETVMEHPVWGVGFAWADAGQATLESGGRGRFWVHNAMLTFWMRFGLVGLATYFYIYYRVISVLYRAYKKRRDYMSGAFLIWFFMEFMGGFFFPPFFGYFKMVALFMGTLALANVHLNTLDAEDQPRMEPMREPMAGGGRILRRRQRDVFGGMAE